MLFDGLTYGTEDDSFLRELLLEGCLDGNRVHDGVDCRATQRQPFFKGNAQLVECFHQFWVYLLLLALRLAGQGVGIIGDGLIVDGRQGDVGPMGLLQSGPVPEGLQAEIEHPLGLVLLAGDESDHLFIESLLDDFGFHIGGETERIFLLGYLSDEFVALSLFRHGGGD